MRQAMTLRLFVASTRAAFHSSAWSATTPAHRELHLLRLADLVERNGEEYAVLETPNNEGSLASRGLLEVGGSVQ